MADDYASDEEIRELFALIKDRTSGQQWVEVLHILNNLVDSGVKTFKFGDIMAILETVVVNSQDNVTVEDLGL